MVDTSDDGAPSRVLRYEGFPLEAVLARVHAAHGADVTITAADRVRRGGIGGFFARETFQVTVTVPDLRVSAARADDEPTFVPLGRMSIIGDDRADGSDDTRFDPAYDDIDPEDVEGALALPVARDAADAEIWALLAAAATASDERPAVEVAPAPVTVRERESAGDTDAVAAALAAVIASQTPPPTPNVPEAPEFVAPVVVAPEVVAPEIVTPIRSNGPIASTTLIPAVSVPAVPVAAVAVAGTIAGTPFDPALAALPVVTSLPPSAEALTTPAVDAPVDLAALTERFDVVVTPPALPTAGVIAVVGARGEALRAAGRIAAGLGIGTDDVIVAAPAPEVVVPSAEDAMRLAATTRYRCNPVAVIVLELVPGRLGHEWVRVVLDGLRPEQIRFAADLTRLLSHQHLSVAAIGGVDALDLLDVTAHPSPTDALVLPTPVGTLDGRPASADLWAATYLAAALRGDGSGIPTIDRSAAVAR